MASNNWQAAVSDFRQASWADPTNSAAYNLLGYSLARLGEHPEAVDAFERALVLDPLKTNCWYYLGDSFRALGDYANAADAYRGYVSLKPRSDSGYYQLYCCLYRLTRYDEAESACRQAIAIDPTNSMYRAALGYCQALQKHYADAIASLRQSLSLKPEDAEAQLWLGECQYRLKAYADAVTSLQKCVSLDATNFYGYDWLGDSLYMLGRYDEAADAYQRAARIKPDDFSANYWRGEALMERWRFDEAVASLESAYAIRKGNRSLTLELFLCDLASSQYEKAYHLYPKFFVIGGGAFTLAYLVGYAFLLRSSLRIADAPAPGFGFSLAWLVLFIEGQVGFVFFFGLLSVFRFYGSFLLAITLNGVPIIWAAARSFARQPWGRPFAAPIRWGTPAVVCLSIMALVVTRALSSWSMEWIARAMHRSVVPQDILSYVQRMLATDPLTVVLSIVVFGPVAEEIVFRGLIYGAFEKRMGVAWAIVISSLVFALVHLQPMYFLPILLLGTVLGWARWKTGSLGLPILLHVLNNGVALVFLEVFGQGT
jgi:tetratricopeptide (TPR) repeat protein